MRVNRRECRSYDEREVDKTVGKKGNDAMKEKERSAGETRCALAFSFTTCHRVGVPFLAC